MPYVSIDAVSDEKLEFLGWSVASESDRFKLYVCYDGTECIVSKTTKPYLWVDDPNDAIILGGVVVNVPQPRR